MKISLILHLSGTLCTFLGYPSAPFWHRYPDSGIWCTRRRCRGVVHLEFLPKAAYLEGRCHQRRLSASNIIFLFAQNGPIQRKESSVQSPPRLLHCLIQYYFSFRSKRPHLAKRVIRPELAPSLALFDPISFSFRSKRPHPAKRAIRPEPAPSLALFDPILCFCSLKKAPSSEKQDGLGGSSLQNSCQRPHTLKNSVGGSSVQISCRRPHTLPDGVRGSSLLWILPRKTDYSASSVQGLGWPCFLASLYSPLGFQLN